MKNSGPQPFPQTRWTLIAKSSDVDGQTRKKALTELCELYWPPVYAFVRSRGQSPHDAEDLVQGFFARLLERSDFACVDESRGRLRTFLLTAVTNYMNKEWMKENRQKRGGDRVIVSLDDETAEGRVQTFALEDHLSPDRIFERQWGITLLEHVFALLREQSAAKGRLPIFEALQGTLTPAGLDRPMSEIADELGMTLNNLKVASHRLRQRYAALLRETLADTLVEGEDPDEELAHLIANFG